MVHGHAPRLGQLKEAEAERRGGQPRSHGDLSENAPDCTHPDCPEEQAGARKHKYPLYVSEVQGRTARDVQALQQLPHYSESHGRPGFAYWDGDVAYRCLPIGIDFHEADLRAEVVNERDDQVVPLHL